MSKPRRRATTSRSTSNRKSRDDISGTTRWATWRWTTFAPHCVSAYGSRNNARTPQAKPVDVSARPAPRAPGVTDAGSRRLAIDAVGACGRTGHAGELGGRRRAVGVDEPDEVGVAAAERLHQHAALAELRVLVEHDPFVVGGVGADHVGGAVAAPVEGDVKAHIGLREAGAIGPQGAFDSLFFVVSGNDDVQGHGRASSSGGGGPGLVWGLVWWLSVVVIDD